MQIILAIAILIICSSEAQGDFFRGKTAKEGRRRRRYRAFRRRRQVNANQESAVSTSTFGTELFSELCDELPPDSNVLFSPLSVFQALALVKDGATRGSKTKDEMEQLLGPVSVQDQYSNLQKLSENTGTDADVQFSMATSIWANALRPSYIEGAKQSQSADARRLPRTYAAVDEWIDQKTKGMITHLMGSERLDPLVVALLVNAVHFKGTWSFEFDEKLTYQSEFSRRGGLDSPSVTASYMTARRKMQVIPQSQSLGGASAVILDYGSSKAPEFSSMFILPATKEDHSMKSVVDGLKNRPITALLSEAREIDTKLSLPRFRLDVGPLKLKPILEDMGMTSAFDEGIDNKFLRMSDDIGLYIDDVHHAACMEVTEKGTEAAAATAVVVRTRSAPRINYMTFNRPFVVVILHRRTGIPLFLGKVENPAFSF